MVTLLLKEQHQNQIVRLLVLESLLFRIKGAQHNSFDNFPQDEKESDWMIALQEYRVQDVLK